jgi:hypothetical protein
VAAQHCVLCRSISSSASFARSPRNTRTAMPSMRHVSRQTILSSTRPANHHRIKGCWRRRRSATQSTIRAAQGAGGPSGLPSCG